MRYLVFFLATVLLFSCTEKKSAVIVGDDSVSRIAFAKQKLSETLLELNFEVVLDSMKPESSKGYVIILSEKKDENNKEGFQISTSGNIISIGGSDASGALYGALELSARIKASGKIPSNLNIQDKPEMVLRGTCIGLQKTEYLPGRTVYEYPYTPESFPWFYDKEHWIEYLDMMVENRYNSLYLWNGHPFASLVKLDDYPYAVEVDEETFKKNEEIFKFIT